MFTLFNFIIAVLIAIVGALLGMQSGRYGMNVLSMIYALAVFLPGLAVIVRRLHDTGRSGWWVLISLVPFVGPIILLVFMCLDSVPSNAYGPNPKQVAA